MNALWTPEPRNIVRSWSAGVAGDSMGDVTDRTSAARFSLPVAFVLAYLRIKFAGGTGTADLSILLDSQQAARHDVTLETIPAVGTGLDINFWVNPGEFHAWSFQPRDELVLQWSSAHASMTWAVEAGLAPVE